MRVFVGVFLQRVKVDCVAELSLAHWSDFKFLYYYLILPFHKF